MKKFQILFGVAFLLSPACSVKAFKIGKIPVETSCIAIAPFEDRFDVASPDEMLSEFLALDLYRLGAKGVLGPRDLSQMFREARDPLPPSIDPYWARTIGQKLEVDSVVFGTVSRIPLLSGERVHREEVLLNVEIYLIDVKTGEIRWMYGIREIISSDNDANQLNRYSEEMALSLLVDRKVESDFGKRNCWKVLQAAVEAVPEPMQQKKEVKIEVDQPLTKDQEEILTKILKGEGYFLSAEMFNERSERLTKNAIAKLRPIAAVLKSSKAPRVTQIAAHVDATSNTADDLRVSKLRADEVKRYLVSLGVPAKRLKASGFGGTQPMVPNITKKSKELNRRIILVSKTTVKK